MKPERLLIANRGEIAIRIARASSELGISSVAVFSTDDAVARHRYAASLSLGLAGSGPAAYLDAEAMLGIAKSSGSTAVHPGYGFLSENAAFAAKCESAGLCFIGPRPETIEILGDKGRAREMARRLGIPIANGTQGPTTLKGIEEFFESLGEGAQVMIKAVSGGGGRGMRTVSTREGLAAAYDRCCSEAHGAFGNAEVYVEQRLVNVRHIEVQIAGDGRGNVMHIGERDCSVQRRNQKLVEIAPAPYLESKLRDRLREAAERMARYLSYRAIGTFEFLVPLGSESFYFIEANPRLQVEHTVTEEVYGIDLVQAQILLASGATLAEAGLHDGLAPRGTAIQLRVNLETLDENGVARPARGSLDSFDLPGGPGIRIDTCGYSGLTPSRAFDSLIAKIVVHHPSGKLGDAVARASRAIEEFRIEGVDTNLGLLQAILSDDAFKAGPVTTAYLDQELSRLQSASTAFKKELPVKTGLSEGDVSPTPAKELLDLPPNMQVIAAPLGGRLVSLLVMDGDQVATGTAIAVIESMKMEHEVLSEMQGSVIRLLQEPGKQVEEGEALLLLEVMEVEVDVHTGVTAADPEHIRPDLAETIERHQWQKDARRNEAVESRNKLGKRTARQNIDDLMDEDSFLEYGPLAVAAQRSRRSIEDLRRISPADGLVAGTGSVNSKQFGVQAARCMVLAYDYTVFAGTQGFMAHRKTDRMLELAERLKMPVVLFAEGGGGRPGDTDNIGGANPSNPSFWRMARLSALVPLVGIVSGRCFAGNAVLLGACDVIIATRDATIGMGGPMMIECGGLGSFSPEEVGPVGVQEPNGVIDLVAADEAEAVVLAKKYLAFFQGSEATWSCADQRILRHVVPENRLRAYDVRRVIQLLADTDSVLELRRAFGPGLVTALARIEGRTVGIIANNPQHLAGAIDADESDKAARFMQLCDAFDIPILSLVDTPGFMVGPIAEKRALVRHTARMFVTAAGLKVPMFVVVLRKGYGLGAMAIGGGSFQRAGVCAISWPTGEFGAMGLEGAVRLAYRAELAAIADDEQRAARYEELVAKLYEHGKAVNIAPFLAFDDVVDPADTRHWLVRSMQALPPSPTREGKRRPNIDPW